MCLNQSITPIQSRNPPCQEIPLGFRSSNFSGRLRRPGKICYFGPPKSWFYKGKRPNMGSKTSKFSGRLRRPGKNRYFGPLKSRFLGGKRPNLSSNLVPAGFSRNPPLVWANFFTKGGGFLTIVGVIFVLKFPFIFPNVLVLAAKGWDLPTQSPILKN